MRPYGFTVVAEGPFDFGASLRFVEDWPATSALPSDGRALRFAYCAEHDWRPIGVTVTGTPGGIAGGATRARGPEIRAEVAPIFSPGGDGPGFGKAGEGGPLLCDGQRGSPGVGAVCFLSPWEAACWAVIV